MFFMVQVRPITTRTFTINMLSPSGREFQYEAPPSKYMRLGSGISNVAKSPIVSCFDVELFAEEDLSNQDGLSEIELVALFGYHDSHSECSA